MEGYKLVVLDIDGTLLTPRRNITRKTKKVIYDLIQQGVQVVISTGRNKRMAKRIVDRFHTDLMYSCVGGTEIYGPNHKPLHSRNLSLTEIEQALSFIKAEDCFIQITRHDGYYQYTQSKFAKQYEIYSKNSIIGFIGHKYLGMKTLNKFEDFLKERFHLSNEILVGGPESTLLRIKEKIESNFEDLQARNDLWKDYLFIGKKNNSKAFSIEWFCKHFGYTYDEVVAIGDDVNDCDMLKVAGLGIAMGNAPQIVKECADDITYTNRENGVAHALEHYIIQRKREKINYIG